MSVKKPTFLRLDDPPKYRGWFGRWARKRCPHSRLNGQYGDEINACGGWRLFCMDCHQFIDGPVSLAESRKGE